MCVCVCVERGVGCGKDLFTRMIHIIRRRIVSSMSVYELLPNNTVWGIAVGQRQIHVFE